MHPRSNTTPSPIKVMTEFVVEAGFRTKWQPGWLPGMPPERNYYIIIIATQGRVVYGERRHAEPPGGNDHPQL
jgi:hypothetical protein